MKTAGEVIKFLNENKDVTVYELSQSFGLSKAALRKRLISLGYTENSMGEWKYNGKTEEEPKDEIVSGKRMKRKRTETKDIDGNWKYKESPDLYAALLALPIGSKLVSKGFKTDEVIAERFKQFCKTAGVQIGKMHSLALLEFLEKYEPVVQKIIEEGKKK
jgi:hypothetical protein